MVDTIKLYTPNHCQVDLGYIERKYGPFKELTVDNYFSTSTEIRNFRFKYDSYGVHLEGSAPRFIWQNNINTLKFHDIPKFIADLSQEVGFDISDLKVTRIDITDNLYMEQCPRSYKRYLGNCPYFQRTDYSFNGLNYLNNTRHLLFYDKLIEIANRGGHIPPELAGLYILRYEYAIKKRMNYHFRGGIETVSDLLCPTSYLKLIDVWEGMFNKIQKISFEPALSMPYSPGVKLKDWLCLRGSQFAGGLTNTFDEIDDIEASGQITKRQSHHLKKTLIRHHDRYNRLLNATGNLKEELINKFGLLAIENRRMI